MRLTFRRFLGVVAALPIHVVYFLVLIVGTYASIAPAKSSDAVTAGAAMCDEPDDTAADYPATSLLRASPVALDSRDPASPRD